MANQTKTQRPAGQVQPQTRPAEPSQARRMQQAMAVTSHGQGQVRRPDTDRRLKANRG